MLGFSASSMERRPGCGDRGVHSVRLQRRAKPMLARVLTEGGTQHGEQQRFLDRRLQGASAARARMREAGVETVADDELPVRKVHGGRNLVFGASSHSRSKEEGGSSHHLPGVRCYIGISARTRELRTAAVEDGASPSRAHKGFSRRMCG